MGKGLEAEDRMRRRQWFWTKIAYCRQIVDNWMVVASGNFTLATGAPQIMCQFSLVFVAVAGLAVAVDAILGRALP
jgi:hypothetical protein